MEKRSRLVSFITKKRSDIDPEFSVSEHQRVIATCEDVPETRPMFPFPLNKVGISEKTVWVNLPEGTVPFKGELYVDLPADFRGIHMSRIERRISELCHEEFDDLGQFSDALAEKILSDQQGTKAYVSLQGLLPLRTSTPISQSESLDSIHVSATTLLEQGQTGITGESVIGVGVLHITSCPCTQVYMEGLFQKRPQHPYLTHSQRCLTWLEIQRKDKIPSYQEVLSCLASCLHTCQDLLKRPDEAELVFRSHRQPQFAEDTVRLVAKRVGQTLGNELPLETKIKIQTISYESIHQHNVECYLGTTLGEILRHIQSNVD